MNPKEKNKESKTKHILWYFQYPAHVHNGKYPISTVRDLTTGIDTCQSDGKSLLPSSKSSQMVTFTFENGAVITLRTSGTEPKIKYYAEMCANPIEKLVLRSLYNFFSKIICFFKKISSNITGIGLVCRRFSMKWSRQPFLNYFNQPKTISYDKVINRFTCTFTYFHHTFASLEHSEFVRCFTQSFIYQFSYIIQRSSELNKFGYKKFYRVFFFNIDHVLIQKNFLWIDRTRLFTQ